MLRLLVEEVMRSLSAAEAEEGTIMDWLMMLAGAGPGEVASWEGEVSKSPDMDCDMLGGSSPTPAMLELSPSKEKKYYNKKIMRKNVTCFENIVKLRH